MTIEYLTELSNSSRIVRNTFFLKNIKLSNYRHAIYHSLHHAKLSVLRKHDAYEYRVFFDDVFEYEYIKLKNLSIYQNDYKTFISTANSNSIELDIDDIIKYPKNNKFKMPLSLFNVILPVSFILILAALSISYIWFTIAIAAVFLGGLIYTMFKPSHRTRMRHNNELISSMIDDIILDTEKSIKVINYLHEDNNINFENLTPSEILELVKQY